MIAQRARDDACVRTAHVGQGCVDIDEASTVEREPGNVALPPYYALPPSLARSGHSTIAHRDQIANATE